MTWLDSHCHLDPRCYGDAAGVDAVVARARAAGVSRMIAIGAGYGLDNAPNAVAVAARHDGVWCTVGVHPHDAKEWGSASEPRLRALAASPKCVAIGEIGLDYHYDLSPREAQRAAFTDQIRIARELSLPVVVHDRESEGECFDTLLAQGAFEGGVLWHCFTGDVELMRRVVDAGGYVSIPGIVTFRNAETMREVVRAAPLERLLVETDSPYLAPVPHRGKPNEPAYVALVGAEVARLRGLEPLEVARITADNAARFFGLTDRSG